MKTMLMILFLSLSAVSFAATDESLGAHAFISEGDCSGNRVEGDLLNNSGDTQTNLDKPKGEIR